MKKRHNLQLNSYFRFFPTVTYLVNKMYGVQNVWMTVQIMKLIKCFSPVLIIKTKGKYLLLPLHRLNIIPNNMRLEYIAL